MFNFILKKNKKKRATNISNNILDLLTKFCVFAFVITIEFRIFENKSISLSDIVFLLVILLVFYKPDKRYFSVFKSNVKTHVLQVFSVFSVVWIISYITPVFGSLNSLDFFIDNRFMIVGAIYLVTTAFVFYFISIRFGWRLIAIAVLITGLVNAILGFTGLILYFYGVETQLVCADCTSSPYMREFPRMVGFSLSPNGYAYAQFSALMMAVALLTNKNKLYMLLVISIIALSLFMSFSKVLLLFLLSYFIFIVLYVVQIKKYRLIAFYGSLFFGIFLYLFVTNILIVEKNEKCNYGNEITILKTHIPDNIKLCPSFFVQQKLIYMEIGMDSFPWGIGVSNKSKPHSTYFERYALHGFSGITSLVLIIYLTAKLLLRIKKNKESDNYVYTAFLLFWIMNLSIALNDDILRFRELWLMIALTMSVATSCDYIAPRPKLLKNYLK